MPATCRSSLRTAVSAAPGGDLSRLGIDGWGPALRDGKGYQESRASMVLDLIRQGKGPAADPGGGGGWLRTDWTREHVAEWGAFPTKGRAMRPRRRRHVGPALPPERVMRGAVSTTREYTRSGAAKGFCFRRPPAHTTACRSAPQNYPPCRTEGRRSAIQESIQLSSSTVVASCSASMVAAIRCTGFQASTSGRLRRSDGRHLRHTGWVCEAPRGPVPLPEQRAALDRRDAVVKLHL